MCTLYERIQELCKAKGVSGSKMCIDLGLSKSTMSDMKKGRTKGVSVATAQKISNYFGITVDELYGEKKEKPTAQGDELTEGEKMLLELFRKIPQERQAEALELLRIALRMQIKP